MKRAAEIFEMVVRLDVDARSVFLDRVCGQDASVRAEVESLLDAHDDAGAFLDEPTHPLDEARGHLGAEDDRPARDVGSPTASRVIGRYTLLEPIGEGGFGAVWMAEQREPVKRRVAIKIIKKGMDSSQVVARFEAERQTLAMMDHPNIAKVFDGGSTESGQPYFVMEYIKGVPILQYCDTEMLETRARLGLFTQACHAIQHAHQKGIIHRDLKPSNVMIALHDGAPVVKVIDFGIAKATNAELTTRTLFTQHNQMIGTPAYMSPEQAEMSGLDIDTRSDVYSLGVLLYELLTGTRPFATEELMGKGFAEMMRIIREEEPHKPSTRLSSLGASATQAAQQRHTDVARLGTLLRGDLDWIVMKCLEKDRTRRYETANGLAADIRRHLSHEPVAAGPPSAAYRLSKFLKRHRVGVLASAAVAAVLVLGIVGTTTGMLRAIHQRERAELAERGMEQELGRATEVKRLITEMLGSINPMVAQGRDTTLLEGILDDTVQRLANGEIMDELIAAELHHVVGVAYRSIGSWDEAERHLPLALETRTRRLGEEHPATLQSKYQLLTLDMYRGGRGVPARRSELKARAIEILEARERVLGAEHPDTLTSMETVGTIIGSFGGLAEAEPIIAKALETRRRVLGPEHRDTLESLAHMALLYRRQGRLAEAEPLLVESLEARTRVLGEDHMDTLVSVGNLFVLYEMQGRHEKSLPLRIRSVAMVEKVMGDRHPYTPGIRLGLGSLYVILALHAEAASVYEGDVRDRQRLHRMKMSAGAVPTAAEIFEVYWSGSPSSAMGNARAQTRTAYRNLATSYDMVGRRADALALYRQLLEHLPNAAGDERAGPFALLTVAWVLTRDHAEVNDPARAVEFARAAAEKAGPTSRNYDMFLDTLALALHQAGATADAIEAERLAIASIPEIEPNPTDARTGETVRAGYEARLRTFEDSLSGQAPPRGHAPSP